MTSGFLVALVASAVGIALGWWLGQRTPASQVPQAPGAPRVPHGPQELREDVGPHLLPEPALDWLRRAHGALGVWVAELDPMEEGPRAERLVDAERLSVAQIVAVDRRLERARDAEESGTETLDSGTLVFRAGQGSAVGLLLPSTSSTGAVSLAEVDVRRLLEGMLRKPQLVAQTQASTREASFESVESIGLRLAYQLERMLVERSVGGEVVVVAAEPTGVRVIGVSGRADRRLLDRVLRTGSDLAKVARGELGAMTATGDPLGGIMADRRQRSGTALLQPIASNGRAIGAVVLMLTSGERLPPAASVEIDEALANAAPRIAQALEADRHKYAATIDDLTGLLNRDGFEAALARYRARRGASEGVLIYFDLDHFDILRNQLGRAAADGALAHVGRILADQVRAGDVPGRIGDARFAIWLPEGDLELGARVADRVRGKVDGTPWDWRGQSCPLTISLGVAAEREGGGGSLASQAEAALELAKSRGANRVEKAG